MISLKSVRIEKFKSFKPNQTVTIEPDVTVLVGMNESGKTSFLKGLAKIKYFDSEDKDFEYDTTEDFPRNELRNFKNNNHDYKALIAEYTISDNLLKTIAEAVGDKTLKYTSFSLYYSYKNEVIYRSTGKVEEAAFKTFIISKYNLNSEHAELLKKINKL